MDALNFAYWLNGFAELHGDTPPTAEQWKSIREHLELVFTKVTPPIQTVFPAPQVPYRPWPSTAPSLSPWPYTVTCSTLAGGMAAETYC